MSGSQGERIMCRQCGEPLSVNVGNCPHCGASLRSPWKMLGAIGFGIFLVIVSIAGILIRDGSNLLFFAILGAVIAGLGYMFYNDRRNRLEEAAALEEEEETTEQDETTQPADEQTA